MRETKTYSAASGAGEDGLKVDSAVEVKRSVGLDIDPMALVVAGGVENRNLQLLAKRFCQE